MRPGRFLVRYSRKVESAGRLPDTWTQTLIDNQVIFQKPCALTPGNLRVTYMLGVLAVCNMLEHPLAHASDMLRGPNVGGYGCKT
jgi:hypothetical protein